DLRVDGVAEAEALVPKFGQVVRIDVVAGGRVDLADSLEQAQWEARVDCWIHWEGSGQPSKVVIRVTSFNRQSPLRSAPRRAADLGGAPGRRAMARCGLRVAVGGGDIPPRGPPVPSPGPVLAMNDTGSSRRLRSAPAVPAPVPAGRPGRRAGSGPS